MPLYEYLCTACGHLFERIQKFSDPLVTVCPKCGGPVEKQFSSPAIQFKGAGWYVNDYAKSGKSDSAKKSEKSDDSGKGGESSQSESSKSESTKSEPTKSEAPAAKPASTDKSSETKK